MALLLVMAAELSTYGLAAILSHRFLDGTEQPIEYASRTLSSSERNYAQVEKEVLAIVFRIKKFHKYLYRHCFVLIADHKPLLAVLGLKQGIPPLADREKCQLFKSTVEYSYLQPIVMK